MTSNSWARSPGAPSASSVIRLASSYSAPLRDSSGAQFLEAMGKGLPAVALDCTVSAMSRWESQPRRSNSRSALRELHRHIAVALRTVLTGDDWAARSAAGIKWASQHIWPAKAAAATQIYEEIIGLMPSSTLEDGIIKPY